jgi:hypothetical protein
MLLLSCRALLDFGRYYLQLSGKNLAERGSIGSNEWQSFLARSARPKQQQSFAAVHQALTQATDGGKTTARVIFSERGLVVINPTAGSAMRRLDSVIVVRSEQDLPGEDFAKGPQGLVRSEKEFSSSVEENWRWGLEHAADVPPDSKLFLNERSFPVYLIGTFFLYPCRVDVDLRHSEIRNDETFEAAFDDFSEVDRTNLTGLEAKLQSLGYTHSITREGDRLRILALREGEVGKSR